MRARGWMALVAVVWLAPAVAGAQSCEADLDGGTTVVSESDTDCFVQVTTYWWDVAEGHDGHHYYTKATAEAAEETYGEWIFSVSVPGDYLVEVYIPSTEADSQGATYHVHHAGGMTEAGVDQSTEKDWQALGVFAFDGSGSQKIHLGDNTGEDLSLQRLLAFDAVRLTYQDPGDDDDAADDDGADDDAADDDSAGDPGWLDHLVPPPAAGDGCQCRAAAQDRTAPGLGLLAVLGLVALAGSRWR